MFLCYLFNVAFPGILKCMSRKEKNSGGFRRMCIRTKPPTESEVLAKCWLIQTIRRCVVLPRSWGEFSVYRTCTVYREIFASFYFLTLSSSLSEGEFKTGRILMSSIISLQKQFCLGEFNTG